MAFWDIVGGVFDLFDLFDFSRSKNEIELFGLSFAKENKNEDKEHDYVLDYSNPFPYPMEIIIPHGSMKEIEPDKLVLELKSGEKFDDFDTNRNKTLRSEELSKYQIVGFRPDTTSKIYVIGAISKSIYKFHYAHKKAGHLDTFRISSFTLKIAF